LNRSPRLRVLAKYPYNAETVQEYLADHYYTPPKMHFERNHNLIPEIDPEEYELNLWLNPADEEPLKTLSLEDVKNLPVHNLDAYLCCAGNKRRYLQVEHGDAVKGLKWNATAIANSRFKGVRLVHVLENLMNIKLDDVRGKHLIMKGYDADF